MAVETTEKPIVTEAPAPVDTGIRHFNQYTLLVVIALSLSFLSYGYTGAVIGTVGGQPSFLKYMNLITAKNATALFGATNGLYYTGGFFGTFYASYAADRWGRKNASIQAQLGLIVAMAIQTGSVHIAMFIVGRFIAGFA
jgi:MFS family permease